MNPLTLLFLPLILGSADFTAFVYCRDSSRGPFEMQCIELDGAAKGTFKSKRRDADTVDSVVQLSAGAAERLSRLLAATGYLQDGDKYESARKVADLGKKRLSVEGPMGRRDAAFNYSERRDVIELVDFMDKLIHQEMIGFNIDYALRYDRLRIPKELDQVENGLRTGRIVDPARLIPFLEKIGADPRVVNYGRVQAARIKKRIEEGK